VCVKFVGFTPPPGRIKVKGRIRLRGQSTAFQYGRHWNVTRFRARHTQRIFFSPVSPLVERDHDDRRSSSPLPHHRLGPDRRTTTTASAAANNNNTAAETATVVTAVLQDRRRAGEEETTAVVGRGPTVIEITILPQSAVYVSPRRLIARTRVLCRCDGAFVCVVCTVCATCVERSDGDDDHAQPS